MPETMTRAEIMDAQRMLNRLGIRDNRGRPLRVDGVAGPRTREALSRYQAQQSAADMPTPAPKGRPANRSTVDRLMPPIPMARPARMFADPALNADIAGLRSPALTSRSTANPAPTPNYDPLGGVQPRPPVPSFMFGGPSAGAPPMTPPMGGGMSGAGMAGGDGPQPYQFSRPPMLPDALQSQWGNAAGLMDAAQQQMAAGGPAMGLPDRGYIPPLDSFAPAGEAPMQPQGPSDAGGLAQMIAGIQDRAAQGQSPNFQPGQMLAGADRSLDGIRGILGVPLSYPPPRADSTLAPPPLPRPKPKPASRSFRERMNQPVPDAFAHPEVGQVVFGYRYLGGDPHRRESWEKVQ